MITGTLLLTSLATALVASAYMLVGYRLRRGRGLKTPADRALTFFAAWWITTALNQFLGAALYFAAGWGFTDLGVQLAYVVVQRLLLSASLAGLMTYLVYLLTGKERWVSITAFYAAFYVFQLYTILASSPSGVETHRWRTDLSYAVATPTWWQLVNLVCIVLPPVVGCVGLLLLVGTVDDRSKRVRIVAVSAGSIVWWLVAVAAGQRSAIDIDALQITNRIIGLGVALAILLAYQPTPWLQRRFKLVPHAAA